MALDTREYIMQTAKALFADKGFLATSIRDIAEAGGFNVSAVNYHFGSKEGLLLAIIKSFVENGMHKAANVLTEVKTIEEFRLRLEIFLTELYATSSQDLDSVQVIHERLDYIAKTEPEFFHEVFLVVHEKVKNFFVMAQKNNVIHRDCNAFYSTMLVLGPLVGFFKNCAIHEEYHKFDVRDSKQTQEFVKFQVDILVNGFTGGEYENKKH